MKSALIASLAVFSSLGFAQEFPVQKYQGKPMFDFKMVDTKDKVLTKQSLKGKVVLIDFWATWCGPCIAAMPTMQRFHDQFASKGLVVIGANILESRNKEAQAAKFLKTKPFKYTFTKNTPANDALARKLEVQGIPTLVLIDRKGTIRFVEVGFEAKKEKILSDKIQQLLKG